MAARRFAKSSIDWAKFAERVPPNQKLQFQLFKAKVDGYTKSLMSLPEKPPALDFAAYHSRLPNAAMVTEFEKQYSSVKVPFPVDKLTASIDEQEKGVDADVQETKEYSDLVCKYYEKRLQWWKDMMPFEEMTMDDFRDYFPDDTSDVYKYPNFWPHLEPPRPVFPYLEKKEHH